MENATAISLFSGLGGIDLGLHRAGIETLVTVDSDEYAADTLRANSSVFPRGIYGKDTPFSWKVIENDIHDVSAGELLAAAGTDDIDFIVGGPPCQTFSRSNEGSREGTDAARGMLFNEFIRLLEEIKPRAFIFENVRGLASANNGEDFQLIKRAFSASGYTTNHSVLNAAGFGVPQTRQRLFIIGFRDGEKPYFPDPTHVDAANSLTGKPPWVTAAAALEEFNTGAEAVGNSGYENAVGGNYGHLLSDIPPGGNYQHFSERKYDPETGEYVERDEDELDAKVFDWRSRHYNYLLKQDPDRPTWTLQAAPGTYVGPFHWRSRRYSFLEQMRLMDVPVDYEICGPPREIQRQIGNAVPPGLATAVAEAMADQLGIGTAESNQSVSTSAVLADGGDTTVNQPVEIDGTHSPWRHAERIAARANKTETITIKGRGKRIAQVIDVVELLQRQFTLDVRTDVEESVVQDPDGSKSDTLSVLHAELTL